MPNLHSALVALATVGAFALAGCQPLVTTTSEMGGGGGSASSPADTPAEAPEEEDTKFAFASTAECVPGQWEFDEAAYSALISEATGTPGIEIEGSAIAVFTDTDFTVTYTNWTAFIETPDGSMTQVMNGEEAGSWSLDAADQMAVNTTSNTVSTTFTVQTPQGSMTLPAGESEELGMSLSGPVTCDQDRMEVSSLGGYIVLNRQ